MGSGQWQWSVLILTVCVMVCNCVFLSEYRKQATVAEVSKLMVFVKYRHDEGNKTDWCVCLRSWLTEGSYCSQGCIVMVLFDELKASWNLVYSSCFRETSF